MNVEIKHLIETFYQQSGRTGNDAGSKTRRVWPSFGRRRLTTEDPWDRVGDGLVDLDRRRDRRLLGRRDNPAAGSVISDGPGGEDPHLGIAVCELAREQLEVLLNNVIA
jgi:hypothetical protein